ncbi:dual specificity protein phosphatase family protein [Candidatus Babeliales bacterium]|nr:dual specificity protein phosphatase family protein [Candidatus Babeliales bacterium]
MKRTLFLLMLSVAVMNIAHNLSSSISPQYFSWICEKTNNKMAGMAQPACKEHIAYLHEHNVGLIVTLTKNPLPPQYFIEHPGIKTLHLPIYNLHVPTIAQAEEFLREAKAVQQQDKGVVVHCKHGMGRTGTLLACWLIANEGIDADSAIRKVRELRNPSISTFEQEQFVRTFYKSRLAK